MRVKTRKGCSKRSLPWFGESSARGGCLSICVRQVSLNKLIMAVALRGCVLSVVRQ